MPILSFFLSILSFSLCVVYSLNADSNVEFFFKNSSAYQDVIVTRIIRTDLIELESGERVRLIGLKAPFVSRKKESTQRDEKYGFVVKEEVSPLTSVEELAFDYVTDLLINQHVRLEFDVAKKDGNHNNFAYVFLIKDKMFVNEEILKQGYANLQIQPPNLKYADQLRSAYKEAFKERRGLQNR